MLNNIAKYPLIIAVAILFATFAYSADEKGPVLLCHFEDDSDEFEVISVPYEQVEEYLERGDILSQDYVLDYDLDGYYDDMGPILPCPVPYFILKEYALGIDCDDIHATNHPGAEEICADGMDNDCNYVIDDEEICDK